jgi:hypothetical protein
MYYYVDTREMLNEPKDGPQWTTWFIGSSQNNPSGSEFSDVINGNEVRIRAMTEKALDKFLKSAYSRAPFLRSREVAEYKGDE